MTCVLNFIILFRAKDVVLRFQPFQLGFEFEQPARNNGEHSGDVD
jgi:hypothetical protein